MDDQQLRQLINNYQPNGAVLGAISNLKLLATMGPTAAGKTTVAKLLVDSQPDFHFVLGETSRPIRPGEKPGVDYIFKKHEDLISDLKKGELVDIVLGHHGDLYGTRLSSYSSSGTNIMALLPPAVPKYQQLSLKIFQL